MINSKYIRIYQNQVEVSFIKIVNLWDRLWAISGFSHVTAFGWNGFCL